MQNKTVKNHCYNAVTSATMAAFKAFAFVAGVVVAVFSAPILGLNWPKSFFLAQNIKNSLSNIAVTTVTTVTFIFFNLIKHRTVLRYSLVTAVSIPP